jgi:hypothetical protein
MVDDRAYKKVSSLKMPRGPIMTFPTLHPIAQTIVRIIVSTTFFLATEYLLDCSGLDKIADYYEFLEHQQETMIHENTEKEIGKAIGKLFVNGYGVQMQLT